MTPEQFLAVTRILPEPSLLVSATGAIQAANPAATTLLQRTPAQLADTTLRSLCTDPPERLTSFLSAAARTRSMRLGALTVRLPTGDTLRCRCEGAVLVPAAAGTHARILVRLAPAGSANRGFALAGKQLEALQRAQRALLERSAELDRARQRADVANSAKADFLATMSHELRTPLNAISGHVQLLQLGIHGPLTPQQQEALHRVQRSQRHLLALVNDVLNFARVESGHVYYELADVAVEGVLHDAAAMIAPELEQRGLHCAVLPVPRGLALHADREKLQQILLNLLSNAMKHTERGGRIELEAGAAGRTVTLCVRDSGCGIPADKHAAIFEPFVQIDHGLTRTHEGAGLGLAISRDLARAMHGDLTVASTPGAGASFTLELPRAAGGARAPAGGFRSPSASAAGPSPRH